jgi:hypothetical protein
MIVEEFSFLLLESNEKFPVTLVNLDHYLTSHKEVEYFISKFIERL